jgi:pyruvate dehydrogenase E2 component (dihydrolipoamide acetyltransferase)
MTSGHLLVWHKKMNESVQAGDLLLEIETDKAVMEVESTQSGIMDYIAVPGGSQNVDVGTFIAVLRSQEEQEGVGKDWLISQGVSLSSDSPEALPCADKNPKEQVEKQDDLPKQEPNTYYADQEVSKDPGTHKTLESGQKSDAMPLANLAEHSATHSVAPRTFFETGDQRILSSPLARKWASHHGIDLHTVQGTGPRGRIVKDDVIGALAQPKRQAEGHSPSAKESYIQQAPKSTAPSMDSQGISPESCRVPLSGMRRTIAQRLTLSKQTVPHFSLSLECRMDHLLVLRKNMNGDSKDLSVNDFMVRACAMALREVPEMRLMWGDETHGIQNENVDLAVAVSIPGGLITPIVRYADTKSLRVLASELKSLIARARQGQLSAREYQGGLFTLSNLGMMGIDQFNPIINPPHTGILAIGATKKRPIVGDDGALIVGQTMYTTIAADHRTIDGSVAAQFLTTFQRLIENPFSLVS